MYVLLHVCYLLNLLLVIYIYHITHAYTLRMHARPHTYTRARAKLILY